MIKKAKETKDTFWIAYADLMAGLLLVFVMLIGAIVVKYVLTQNDLDSKDKDLKTFQQRVEELTNSLHNVENNSSKLQAMNFLLKEELKNISIQTDSLNAKNKELNLKLQDLESEKDMQTNKTLNLQNQLLEVKQANEKNINQIKTLQSNLTQKELDFNLIMKDLNATKQRVQGLSSSKDRVIQEIKGKLGSGINIDSSGSLSLSSSIFFDKGSSVLKESSKAELQRVLTRYFDILMNNKNIKDNLDYIIIEGHTDSDGSYLTNLQLSQQRAYNVMEFINSFIKNDELKKYLMASGRSYMDVIRDANGKENKDASRRIEIKFAISDKEVMKEIENFLNYESSSNR